MTTDHHHIPIIRLWGHLLVPVQGEVSDHQAESLFDEVLHELEDHGALGLILDLSGVTLMDSHLCAVIAQLASSARLMGTPTVVCGIRPEIALTLQTMGVRLDGVRTTLTLEDALDHLGVRLAPTPDATDDNLPARFSPNEAVEVTDLAQLA